MKAVDINCKQNGKRRKLRCLNCRKLKIKCDEARPSCEYCSYRNYKCVYPNMYSGNSIAKIERAMTKDVSTYSTSAISQSQISLNSIPSLIGISHFEYQLICYYQKLCEADFKPHPIPEMNLWFTEVKRIGFHSELVRSSIYAISTMHLDNLDFYDSFRPLAKSELSSKFLNVHNEIFEPSQVRGFFLGKKLYRQTVQYFIASIQKTLDIIYAFECGDGNCLRTQAVEILISSLIIFNLLLHHQSMFLPLISSQPSEPSLLSICKGMKNVMAAIYPYIEETNFGILFRQEAKIALNIPISHAKIALIEHLNTYRIVLEEESEISERSSLIYIKAVKDLEILLRRLIVLQDHSVIWGWISELDDEFYALISERREYFAFKLLFYYCLFRINVTGLTGNKGNTWTHYCNWFRSYNLVYFGKWRDSKDHSLYDKILLYKYGIKDIVTFII